MAPTLHPCAACSRHVLSSEESCPFCGSALSPGSAPKRPLPKRRMSRAALVAFGTLAASPQIACGGAAEDDSNQGDRDSSGDGDMAGDGDTAAPVYGIAPSGGTTGSGGTPLVGTGGAPVYGAPITGGTFNEGGMGGESSSDGSGGDDDVLGTGGAISVPVYGLAPTRR